MRKTQIILLSLLFFSCLGSKKVVEKSNITKQFEKTEIKNDSSKVETVNKAIEDKASFKIPESKTNDAEFDKRVNEAIANILKSIDFQKSSGDNSFRFWYDMNEKLLKMEASIGETKNTATNSNKSKNTEKSFEQQIDEYIYKKIKVMPWWMYGIIAFLFRNQLVGLLSFFFSGIRSIKSFSDLRKKLTPKIRSPVQ